VIWKLVIRESSARHNVRPHMKSPSLNRALRIDEDGEYNEQLWAVD